MTEVPTEVAPGLSVVRLDPELAMRKYTADALRSERLASILFHSKIARGFLTGIPGPRDWAILGQAWSFSRGSTYESKHPDDRYDLVIVDGPSSGDGANMLRVPEVIIDLAVGARLRKDAESCLAMLRNKERTAIVLVTLSEELPLREAEESLAVLRDEMALPVGALFVNEVVTPLLSEADRNILRSLSDEDLDREAHSGEARSRSVRVLDVGRRRAELEARQARHEKRIEEMGLPVVKLPALPGENQGKGRMRKLQIALAEGH